jgi:hypothetical protein
MRFGDICVALEHALCFGCAPLSSLAQRFTHLVRQVVTERMIAEDAPFVVGLLSRAWTHLSTWFAPRDALMAETGLPQELLFHISIYTDDSGKGAIWCKREARRIRIWTEVCSELGVP